MRKIVFSGLEARKRASGKCPQKMCRNSSNDTELLKTYGGKWQECLFLVYIYCESTSNRSFPQVVSICHLKIVCD